MRSPVVVVRTSRLPSAVRAALRSDPVVGRVRAEVGSGAQIAHVDLVPAGRRVRTTTRPGRPSARGGPKAPPQSGHRAEVEHACVRSPCRRRGWQWVAPDGGARHRVPACRGPGRRPVRWRPTVEADDLLAPAEGVRSVRCRRRPRESSEALIEPGAAVMSAEMIDVGGHRPACRSPSDLGDGAGRLVDALDCVPVPSL